MEHRQLVQSRRRQEYFAPIISVVLPDVVGHHGDWVASEVILERAAWIDKGAAAKEAARPKPGKHTWSGYRFGLPSVVNWPDNYGLRGYLPTVSFTLT